MRNRRTGKYGSRSRVEALDGLGDQEMEIGVALAVGVATEIDGEPVDEEGDVGAVVGVEAAQEVLFRLATSLMLADHQPGDESQDVSGSTLRQKLAVATGNQDLGG